MHDERFEFTELSELRTHRFSLGYVAKNLEAGFYLKSFRDEAQSKDQFHNEVSFYGSLGTIEHIMPVLGTHEIFEQIFLVFPFVEKDLFDYVGKVTEEILISDILSPLLDSLHLIHQAGYVHADIKLENIRVAGESSLNIYLSDFGKALKLGAFSPNRLGGLPQHIPPDATISPQMDIYSVGVLAFQLLFGLDFIKKFQMSGRDFEQIPEAKKFDSRLLRFILLATESSARNRFKSAVDAKSFLLGEVPDTTMGYEAYDLDRYFEFYLECMRTTFIESGRPTSDFDEFVGPWGERYYRRLTKWLEAGAHLVHLTKGSNLVGICEATVRGDGVGLISSIFLAEGTRGHGGAQILEESALKFFGIQGVRKATLNVAKGNERAIGFYRKRGWTESLECPYPDAIQFTKDICRD